MAKRKKLLTALFVSGVVLLGVYIGGGVYYSNHFFPNTTVGGISCGNQTAAYVESQNIASAEDYLLNITDRKDTSYHLTGMDFGYAYNANGEESALLQSQNGFLWPVAVFQEHNYDLNRSFSYDEDSLTEEIDALTLFDKDYIEAPTDAYLEITDEDYQIVPEEEGNTPLRDEVIAEITAAIDNQQSSLTLSDNCYEKPSVCSTDSSITDTVSQIDTYTASTVHYDIEDADETLDKAKILSMLDIADDGTVSINDDKLTQYVQYLASTYNTYGDVRKFKTSMGDTIKIGGGDYGWVVSKANEKEELLKDLQGGEPVEREPVYEQRALYRGADDIGDTYVELDYTNQHLWYYKEGKLKYETDIVSGTTSTNSGSPDGIFKIAYKERNATLVGEGYVAPVDYFIPFAYNVGIHDSSWRTQFGGEIYKTNGSHGCINVSKKASKKLYKILEVGTPVIAYYREPITLTAENTRISNAYSYKKTE